MTRERDAHPTGVAPVGGIYAFAVIAIGMMVAGSFIDLSLAQSLYTPENTFGVVFAAYGEAPALLALVAAGTLAVTAQPPVHTILRWLLVVGGAGLIVVGTLALVIRPEEYWPLPTPARALIAISASTVTIWITARLAATTRWQVACVLAGALFAVVAVEMITVQGLKIFWERPRMRMLTETGSEFAPWWSPGYEAKQSLMEQGVESSEFKSFPSGHSANSAVAITLAGFAMLREDLKRHQNVLFAAGALWALTVAFSRMTMGAHFLTDTGMGIGVSIVAVAVVSAAASTVLRKRLLDRLEQPRTEPAGPRHSRAH